MPRLKRNRIISILLASVIGLLTLLPLGGCSDYRDDSKQVMEKLDIAAQLTDNGDMTVKETWKVNLQARNKDYRNLYRTFPIDPEKADDITDLKVYDENNKVNYDFVGDIDPEFSDTAKDNTCYIHKTYGEVELGWFMPAIEEGVRTFTFSYTVKNIVAVHNDRAELYNFFIPKKFSLPVTDMSCTIQFPAGGDQKELRTWLHSTANGSIKIDSANQVSFTAKEIPAQTSVEVRLLMPPQLFSASEKQDSKNVLNDIVAQENKWAEDYRAEQLRRYFIGIADVVFAASFLIAALILFVLAKKKNERYSVDAPEYTREIPPGNSPGGIANLFYFYHGGITKNVEGKVFSATLLSLARKGYIRFDGAGNEELAISVIGNTKNIPLEESEQDFFNMISTVADHFGGSFTMKQFKRYAETGYKYIDNNINSFLSRTKREIARRGYYQNKSGFLSALSAIGILAIVLAVAAFLLSSQLRTLLVYTPISLILCGVILLIAGSAKPRLSKTGEYDYMVWHGLSKYMSEFSRLNEYGVPQLELWEEYLVYATMMGISKKVCDQLKVVYPQLNDEGYVDTYFGNSYMYYMFGHPMGLGGFHSMGSDFGTTLASTISDISSAATRLAHPPADNNSGGFGGGGFGGGSFGGGGGGFGGGGGGGVR